MDDRVEQNGPDTPLPLCESARRQGAEPERAERRFPMSYEAFLAWSDEDTHTEWVNGEVIVFMPPVTIHQLEESQSGEVWYTEHSFGPFPRVRQEQVSGRTGIVLLNI